MKNEKEGEALFSVGDRVAYPMHGAGVIEAIEEKEILGARGYAGRRGIAPYHIGGTGPEGIGFFVRRRR